LKNIENTGWTAWQEKITQKTLAQTGRYKSLFKERRVKRINWIHLVMGYHKHGNKILYMFLLGFGINMKPLRIIKIFKWNLQ
jgi:hypothetical protein